MFMIAVDTTVVNLALPLIGRGLHAQVAGLQWTIAAYTITTASLMLTSGSIGDRFAGAPCSRRAWGCSSSRPSGAPSPPASAG
jgi:MFS family permease